MPAEDEEVFRTPYPQARAWATPAQGAALDHLSQSLKLTSDGRLGEAYQRMTASVQAFGRRASMWQAMRQFDQARLEARRSLEARWPELRRSPEAPGYAAARKQAVAALERRERAGRLRELFDAEAALTKAEEQEYQAGAG